MEQAGRQRLPHLSELASSTVGQHSDTHRIQIHVYAHVLFPDQQGDTRIYTGCMVFRDLHVEEVGARQHVSFTHALPPPALIPSNQTPI